MDAAKTAPLFHLCWKWKYDVEQCYLQFRHHTIPGLENALACLNQLVSMVLETLCDINDCLCMDFLYPLLDSMYRFVQPFFVTLSTVDMDELHTMEPIVELAQQAQHDLCVILLNCSHGHALLLSKYNV